MVGSSGAGEGWGRNRGGDWTKRKGKGVGKKGEVQGLQNSVGNRQSKGERGKGEEEGGKKGKIDESKWYLNGIETFVCVRVFVYV